MELTREQRNYIAQLYRNMYGQLHTYAYGILRDQYLSEEAVQETFRTVCGKPNDLMTSPNPKGWLVETLKNVIRNTQRKRATMEKYIAAAESVDLERIVSPDCDSNVDLMYSGLVSEEEFNLLKRVAIDGYTMLEAAEELDITVEACKKRVQRVKEKFRQKIEDMGVP